MGSAIDLVGIASVVAVSFATALLCEWLCLRGLLQMMPGKVRIGSSVSTQIAGKPSRRTLTFESRR